MIRFDVGQTVRVIDKDSPYCNYTGTVRQIIGLDFGISDMIDKFVVDFIDWPEVLKGLEEGAKFDFKAAALNGTALCFVVGAFCSALAGFIEPGMVVSMIEVGEETGALPEMLNRIADVYEEEVDRAVEALTSLIEPVMIVVLAVIVAVTAAFPEVRR